MVEAAREENNVQEQGKWVWREGSRENKSVLAQGGPSWHFHVNQLWGCYKDP